MEQDKIKKVLLILIILLALGAATLFLVSKFKPRSTVTDTSVTDNDQPKDIQHVRDLKIKKFTSEEEFKQYLSESQKNIFSNNSSFSRRNPTLNTMEINNKTGGFDTFAAEPLGAASGSASNRVSQTNVQVAGIDEPDIVKTDGKEIYYSRQDFNERFEPSMGWDSAPGIMAPRQNIQEITTLQALPIENLQKIGKIEKYGKLLLHKDRLVIFTGKEILGYDISNPKNPQEKWKLSLEDKHTIVQARKIDNEIYIISSSQVNISRPCPLSPAIIDGETLSIRCQDIYHPAGYVPVDSTYTVMALDIASGSVKDTTSFVGSSANSTIYMNATSIYITYNHPGDIAGIYIDFISQQTDLFSPEIITKAQKLRDYDISQQSKMSELELILEQLASTDDDARLKFENELKNRIGAYFETRKRDFDGTGIVKITTKGLDVEASGLVPGTLLNQFSLDEYNNNLRVATTIGGEFTGESGHEVNDVYILDKNLKEKGSIKDLGADERIYSARFIGDRGYLVTFRQTDPFYVLDLSDADKPRKAGELKIPGYSSYLHPLDKNLILGIGKEGSSVKLSLFDVSSPDNPQEADKYLLSEYWSEALNNHHAFLADSDNKIFFLPGSKGGYVFSYQGNKLALKVATSEMEIQRALYINNYLYVLGKKNITVYNEKDWTKVREIEL